MRDKYSNKIYSILYV